MKKAFVSCLFIAVLFACQGVEKYRAGIEGLSSTWDAATSSFTEFSSMLNAEQASFSDMAGKMNIDEAVFAKLTPEVQEQINTAKAAYQTAGSGYAGLIEQATGFASEWTAKGAELTALKDGLTQGKLEGDVMAKITELTSYATAAGDKISGFKGAFDTVKASCATSHTELTNAMAAATAAVAK